MDEDSLGNWGYYEPPVKGHLGLQLMSSMAERDTKPYVSNRDDSPLMVSANGTFRPRDCMMTEPPITHMDYVQDSWINHREKFLHMFPGSPYDSVLAEHSGTNHSMQMVVHQPEAAKEIKPNVEEPIINKEGSPAKKRAATASTKSPKSKKPRKGPAPKDNGNLSGQRAKTSKKNVEVVINGIDMDITGISIPVCSCTSTPQQCYRRWEIDHSGLNLEGEEN